MITTMEIRKELLNYIVFGVLTTLMNILIYQVLSMAGVTTLISNGIAWILSVLFAYVTNRKYVFDSHSESSEYSGVAEPGIPPNRATLIPVAKARVSTTESHMKRGNFEHMCG